MLIRESIENFVKQLYQHRSLGVDAVGQKVEGEVWRYIFSSLKIIILAFFISIWIGVLKVSMILTGKEKNVVY